ncbi:hypothetical protein [Bacillus mycoides]
MISSKNKEIFWDLISSGLAITNNLADAKKKIESKSCWATI